MAVPPGPDHQDDAKNDVEQARTSGFALPSLPLPSVSLPSLGDMRRGVSAGWEAIAQLPQWFRPNEAQIAEILEKVRSELPTTEVLLIGKPQTGKSSIVRGLTGVSDDIIGQGFRPHTRHTQRYQFPNDDLPLLSFTDTVGLGDVEQDSASYVQELTGELDQAALHRARIMVLTIKVTDFANDTLRQIVQEIRETHPEVPCLLAVTCLHEAYPPDQLNHPDYPPTDADIERAVATLRENFRGLFDDLVLIDFTLEADGFDPVFYGLPQLVTALGDLLPEAESRTIHQLLAGDPVKEIGNLYRNTARRYILPFSVTAATAAAVPLPFATMPVLTTLQVSMVVMLGQLYGQTLSPSQAGGLVSAIAGGFLAQAVGRELIKFIPGFGSVIAASWAAAYTWALGEAACVYFGDLMGGKTPDKDRIQQVMRESFATAREKFRDRLDPPSPTDAA